VRIAEKADKDYEAQAAATLTYRCGARGRRSSRMQPIAAAYRAYDIVRGGQGEFFFLRVF
jgi:hypothetical protein